MEAAHTTSSHEAKCIVEVSELRQSASRAEIGNHENMVGQRYQVVSGRGQTIQRLRTELAIAQSQLQNRSQSQWRSNSQMHVARAQVASMESSVHQ